MRRTAAALLLTAAVGCGGSSGVPTVGHNVTAAPASPSQGPEVAAPVLTASPRPAGSCSATTKQLGAGQSQTCQFIATKRGGANVFYTSEQPEASRSGAADVFVTRAGVTTRHDVYHAKSGCLQGFIEPGDRVIVTVRQVVAGHSAFVLSAGAGFGCN
jgi:hypothetical protein